MFLIIYIFTITEESLFYLQCDFVFHVFILTLQTDKSKSIFNKYIELGQPTATQDIFTELQKYFKDYIIGKDQIEKYCNYCATTRINNGKFNRSIYSYILYFQ